MTQQTPIEYLDYLTTDIENAKEKPFLYTALVSHLYSASVHGWLTESLTRSLCMAYVEEWRHQ